MRKIKLLIVFLLTLLCSGLYAQEENPFLSFEAPSQNTVKFNRFLINPTFSTVREDKSYINLFHRNQLVSFDDNNQTYFLSYSGRIGDKSGVGLSLYTQRVGLFSNVGLLANYAYGIKLSEKSNFTFGGNFSYYTSGFDQGRATTLDPNDALLNSLDDSSLITFQPGFNLSYGQFDFGAFAENLFDYNLKTSESITDFNEKTFSGHLQYTHQFKNSNGIFESGRLMPLARVRRVGEERVDLGGSLILDLPKLGWLQAGYDDFFGAAAGIGFNLNKHVSLGYTIEKAVNNNLQNFGTTHEISLAYSLTPNLTENRVLLDDEEEDLVLNEDEVEEISLTEKDSLIAELQQKLAENDAILDELLLRQDSIEKGRQADLERRFNMVMRLVQRETNKDPGLRDKASNAYFESSDSTTGIANNYRVNSPISNQGITSSSSTNRVISLSEKGTTPSKDANIGNTNIIAAKDAISPGNNQRKDLATSNEITTENSQLATTLVEGNNGENAKTTSAKDAISLRNNKRKDLVANSNAANINTAQDNTYQPNTIIKAKTGKNKFKSFKIPNIKSGHYLIANVYKDENYMHKYLDELHGLGIEADYFENPKNNMKYVYLKESSSFQEIASLYKSNLNGRFDAPTWVMTVKGTDEAYDGLAANDSKYGSSFLQKNIVKNNNQNPSEVYAKTFSFDGAGSGYYIIANVFANTSNAKRFVKHMNAQGLNASYFVNPENNYKYVYLKRHETWNNALISYYNKLDSAYNEKMWIMRVKPNSLT